MKCQQIERRSISYLDGKLTPHQREEMELHLRVCSSCAGRLKGFFEVSRALNTWGGMEPSASFNARLERLIEQEAAGSGWWNDLWSRLASLPFRRPVLALSTLAVICLAAVLMQYSPAPPETPVRSEQPPMVASMVTETDELALYQNLPVLEDWDLLRNFEVLQELSSTNPSQP